MPKEKGPIKKKSSSAPLICIIILLLVVVIAVYALIKNKKQESEVTPENGDETNSVQEEIQLPEQSLIDMNNTENAKVEDGTKENTSSKLAEPKTYKGLTIKDIKLKAEGGITRLTATIENNSGTDYEGEGITVVFTNQDGSEYARLEGILPSVDNGKTNELDAATTADIANAYDFTIE